MRQEPARHPFFVINNLRPFNAEPPPELLLDAGFITPNELYYVRNHLPVPTVDPEKYRLHVEVGGKVGRCVQYSLADLKSKFPQVTRSRRGLASTPFTDVLDKRESRSWLTGMSEAVLSDRSDAVVPLNLQ